MSLISLGIILGGVVAGMLFRKTLPERYLSQDTKDVVTLGSGLIGMLAALVLGMLIASANTASDAQSGHVNRLAAQVIQLDYILGLYGPETITIRSALRDATTSFVARVWRENQSDSAKQSPFQADEVSEEFILKIYQLTPLSDLQRLVKERAVQISSDILLERLLLFEQAGNPIPVPFLAILIFWLSIIFASYGMFSRPNATIAIALCLFAFSAAGAIFLILELSEPFGGWSAPRFDRTRALARRA